MRKIYVLGLALLSVFALSVASASANEPALWLVKGAEFTGELAVDIEGLLELENLSRGITIDCEGVLVGTITGGSSDGSITEVLDLAEKVVNSANPLACATVSGACEAPLVFAENLPWLTTLELMTTPSELFLVLLSSSSGNAGTQPAYAIDCLVFTILFEELCEGETSASFELMTGNVLLGIFEKEELVAEGLEGTCSGTGTELVANLNGTGEVLLTGSTEELDVSSE